MCTSLRVVDVSSMSQSHHDDHKHVVLDDVADAVVADPDAKAWPTPQISRTGRSWVLGEQGDCPLDATTNLRIEHVAARTCV
jgi:hypothetical protein